MTNLLLTIDAGMVDWARAQFALTAIYHWLFVPLTLGLAVIMGIIETKYYLTKDVFWRDAERCCQVLAETIRRELRNGRRYGHNP